MSIRWWFWKDKIVSLEEAVFLSLNIEPVSLENDVNLYDQINCFISTGEEPEEPNKEELKQIIEDFSARNDESKAYLVFSTDGCYLHDKNKRTIDLKVFGDWAISMGWDIPEEFPRELQAQQKSSTATDVPKNELTREELVMLEVERRNFPDKANGAILIPKGEKASICRYFQNHHYWSESVFNEVWKKLRKQNLVFSENTTV